EVDAETAMRHSIDIQQIFPKGWFKRTRQSDPRANSVVNKTVLSYETSRRVGTRAPSAYLALLAPETGTPTDWLDDRVTSHLIDSKTLREDNFSLFFQDRTTQLLGLIEEAMHKAPVRADRPSVRRSA